MASDSSEKKGPGPSPASQSEYASDLGDKITRRFGRHQANCAAVLAFPSRNAHPRVKGKLLQIGEGGACVSTVERKIYIGETCLVWATGGGHKFLGVQGRIVWMKSVYESHETILVGIEFEHPLELTPDLLSHLGVKT